MMRSKIFAAVCTIALFAGSLQATDECPEVEYLCNPFEQFQQLFGEKVEAILLLDRDEDGIVIFDFDAITVERLLEAIRFMEDSKELLAEAEPCMRDMYYFNIIEFYVLAAEKTPDKTQSEALFAEALKNVDHLSGESRREYIEYIKRKIRFILTYGLAMYNFIEWHEGEVTIEEALAIEDRMWRNKALGMLVYFFLEQEPPNFADALRAADAIQELPTDDWWQQMFRFSDIAVMQFQLGQVDDAEKTLRKIQKDRDRRDYWFETNLIFVLICDETGNTALARRYIDAVFAEARKANITGGTILWYFSHFRDCLVQLKTAEIARYIAQNMVSLYEELEKEYQERIAENPSRHPFDIFRDDSRKKIGCRMLANVLLHIGEREEGLKYLHQFREMIPQHEERSRTLSIMERTNLIAIQYNYGLRDDAKKEIADVVARIHAGEQTSTGGNATKSQLFRNLFNSFLWRDGLLAEAARIAQLIPDEAIRFEAYEQLVDRVGIHFRPREGRPELKPQPRFSSRQEILDIVEALIDEPGGKSLESYRARILQFAERLP